MKKITGNERLDSKAFENTLGELKSRCPGLNVNECGRSLLGKRIYTLTLGRGARRVLFAGGIHAGEYMGTLAILRFAEELLNGYAAKGEMQGYPVSRLFNECTLVCVPLANPDGADISLYGEKACGCYGELCKNACGGDFSHWNANARGVDINHNFDAGWALLKEQERALGLHAPSPGKYGGEYPESEPETAALTRLCRELGFERMLAFHSQGGEIYWRYGAHTPPVSKNIAEIFAAVSGYALKDNSGSASHGGFKDWFIDELHSSGFTVEIGEGENPLPIWQFDGIYERVKNIMVYAMLL